METITKSCMHIRCNSFPSAPHPFASQFQENLQRLKDSEAATTSFSSSSVSQNLIGLQDLHECVDKLLQLPTTQKALAQECSGKLVDDLLEGSVRILDICAVAQDCLSQSKECMREIQSVIRRRGPDTGFAIEGGKYLATRRKIKKAIQKALCNLKGIKAIENSTFSMLSIVKDADAVTLRSLESLLLFISDSKGQTKKNRWSIVSNLMQPARVACDSQECDTNEFVKVDAALQSLISHKTLSTENFLSQMENMEICIQDLEVGVERLSRQLIRTRVSLLNIFSH